MTTAHRPTFDPARGKESLRGPAYHQRLLPAYKTLKRRQPGQGGDAETGTRDLRAELLQAEAAHFAKGSTVAVTASAVSGIDERGVIEASASGDALGQEDDGDENPEAKRRRLILNETRDIDADSEGSGASSSEEDSEEDEDEEDEEAELMRELEKIKKERAEQRAKEEAERAKLAEEQKELDIARGNPLMNPQDFSMKRRWDEDVVFKNQGRVSDDSKRNEFVNDLLRSDFHKRFMSKYVR